MSGRESLNAYDDLELQGELERRRRLPGASMVGVVVSLEFLETLHMVVSDYDDLQCGSPECVHSRYQFVDVNLAPRGLCARHQSTSKAKAKLFELLEKAKSPHA